MGGLELGDGDGRDLGGTVRADGSVPGVFGHAVGSVATQVKVVGGFQRIADNQERLFK